MKIDSWILRVAIISRKLYLILLGNFPRDKLYIFDNFKQSHLEFPLKITNFTNVTFQSINNTSFSYLHSLISSSIDYISLFYLGYPY